MYFELLKLANVADSNHDSFGWFSLNNDPQFHLKGWSHLINRRATISFRIATESQIFSQCLLYLDHGKGYSEEDIHYFSVDENGRVSETFDFSENLKGVRLDPLAQSGLFSITDLNIEVGGFVNESAVSDMKPAVEVDPIVELNIENDFTYEKWIDEHEPAPSSYPILQKIARTWEKQPLISIVMPTYNTDATFLKAAIDSVKNQTYEHWELCIADDASTAVDIKPILDAYAHQDSRIKVVYSQQNAHISQTTNAALAVATGEYIGFLDHDDALHPIALHCVADAINTQPGAAIIYSDEDKITATGERQDPYFKCDFNYDLFLSQNMICHFGVYKHSVVKAVGGMRAGYEGSQDYDLALRVLDHAGKENILHIPRVLYHWRMHDASTAISFTAKPYAQIAAINAVQDHLDRNGIDAKVETDADFPAYNRVRYLQGLKSKPSVEIIIPTKDCHALVAQCVTSVLEKTTYSNYRISIVDNQSEEPETFTLFDELTKHPNVNVIKDTTPFNFAHVNNVAGLKSEADLICLLNNDIEVISEEWLSEMVSLAVRPEVGCVGAKLLFPDDTVQHAGVVVSIGGVAGHSHKQAHKSNPGYFSRLALVGGYSAVTAACLLVKRSIYQELSGLDERLAIAFNDVDFCLRVRELGYSNVWTPYAVLYHHESASRGYENDKAKVARFNSEVQFMKDRWAEKLEYDPYYSPNLTNEREDFSFAWPARVPDLTKS